MLPKILISSGLLAIALVSLVASYLAGHPVQSLLFYSDALYLPILFSNLISNGGNIGDWYLTPAPYFFPDYPLYLGAYVFGGSTYIDIIIFTIFQIIATFIGTYFISKQIVKNSAFFVSALTSVVLIWLSLNVRGPFVFLLVSAHHYGTFISGIFFIALAARYLNCTSDKQRWFLLIALSTLAFLTSLSDNLFLVQVLVPFSASFAFVNLLSKEKKGNMFKTYIPSIVPTLFGVLGSFSYSTVVANNTRHENLIGLQNIGINIDGIFSVLQDLFTKSPILVVYLFVFFLFSVFCLLILFKRRYIFDLPKEVIHLIIFSLFSTTTTISAILLLTNFSVTPRYLIPVFLWPVIIGSIIGAFFMKNRFFIFSSIFSSSLSGLACRQGTSEADLFELCCFW